MAETTTTTTDTSPRSLAERARGVFLAAQQRVADYRAARARGDAGAPSAAALAKAREDAELAEDRAKLAEEAARAHAAAEERRRQAEAIHARRAELQAIYAAHLAASERLVRAAEEMAAAMDAFVGLGRDLAQREPSTAGFWLRGRIDAALSTVAAPWPQSLALPSARPMPFRDAATRAAWPQQQDLYLREKLPLPALPDTLPDDAQAAAA